MPTIEKRGKNWRARIRAAGVNRSKTFATKAAAQKWAVDIESAAQSGTEYAKNSGLTVTDLLTRYSKDVTPTKKGEQWEQVRINLLLRDELALVPLSKLAPRHMAEWRDRRLQSVSAASVNRELNLLSAAFNIARREWGWLANNPIGDIQRPPQPRPRFRRISDEESARVLEALNWKDGQPVVSQRQLAAARFLLAIETAMRLGEICGLTPDDVHLDERYVVLRNTKNNDIRHVALSRKAVELLRLIMASDAYSDSKVCGQHFYAAVRLAGINDLHFHDTRHEALTRLARKLDVLDLARMVGHRDPRSLMIYYNPTPQEIAARLD